MRLLIDGYNLLHATDLFGAGELAGTLRGSREALLRFLASRLTSKERRSAVIVFDARDAPVGLPDRHDFEEIDVRFARDYPDADAMIEAILERAKGTRDLIVVSGDRRVQRAARSRGSKPVDSEAWFRELCQREIGSAPKSKPTESVGDAAAWIREFSDAQALKEIERDAAATPPPRSLPTPLPRNDSPKTEPVKREERRGSKRQGEFPPSERSKEDFGRGIDNPFPPGYGEDIVE